VTCDGGKGYLVVIPLLLSYLFYLSFAVASIGILYRHTIVFVTVAFGLTSVMKVQCAFYGRYSR